MSKRESGFPEALRLEVKNLEVRLGESGPDIVREVSFSLSAGELLGIVGESGSGKTTVALALLGYARRGLAITNGQVLLNGIDILRLPPKELRGMRGRSVAYVPQDPSAALNPTLRIGTQLREALKVHRGLVDDMDARVVEVLHEASLDPSSGFLRRYPHQLSGGQQQRVALAMAFSCRPSLIVLDEPTTGLDVTTQRHVLDTVRRLCQSYGTAGVYVSHDIAVAGGLVTGMAVMYAGRVIELGPMARILGFPMHPYTRGLLAAVPSPDRAELLSGIEGQPPRPGRRPDGCSFAPRCAFVIKACTAQSPRLVEAGNQLVRCIRTAEIRAQGRERMPRPSERIDTSRTSLLSVRGINAFYGLSPVLCDVSLDVDRDTCLGVVGESGSGKTTLARCISGLHRSWRGEMSFGGAPLEAGWANRPKAVLRRIQYIFQNPYTSLNPRKTVGQLVSQPLENLLNLSLSERTDRVAKVLKDVSLGPEIAARFPDQLSGGERQRVAIARALIVEPDLLVCDEITSALDVSVQALIVELLRRLQREHHLAIIFITHNLAVIRAIAQRVVVLSEGRLLETGTVDEVLEHPKDPYTIRLMQDVPKLPHPMRGVSTGTANAS